MSLSNCKFFVLLFCCALALGCRPQDDNEISATAAAEASPDGSVRTRQATSREIAELNEGIRKRNEIDKQFPGAPTPWGSASERVTDVFVPGVLKLAGGRSVQLDGIRCDEKAVGYLRRILQEDASVSVVLFLRRASQPNQFPPKCGPRTPISNDKALQKARVILTS